ncbi:MAG: hypothetical protein ACRDH9_02505 [Actinomycetota bacterium]
MAAVLVGGDGALVSHRSAAALHGLEPIPQGMVEITLPSSRRIQGAIVHRRPRVEAKHQLLIDGIPATRVERTVVDLASVLSVPQMGMVLDHALHRRRITLEDLSRTVESHSARGRAE